MLEIQYDNINYNDIYTILKDEQFGISITGVAEQLGITKYRINKLIEAMCLKLFMKELIKNKGRQYMQVFKI